VLVGFLWQPDIERQRTIEPFDGRREQPERAVFPPPQTAEVAVSEPNIQPTPLSGASIVPETPPVRKAVRQKPVARKFADLKPRPKRVTAPEPVLDIPAPRIAAAARFEAAPIVYDSQDLPKIEEQARAQKPSTVRRVFGSIPLLGFLKKKKPPREEETATAPRQIDGVSTALTSKEDPLSSSAQRPTSPATGSRPRTAGPVER
jgi:hypothetical protein